MSTAAVPTEDAFRDLARASHRLWTTCELEHGTRERESVHAWIRRPFDLRVETSTGHVIAEHSGNSTSVRVVAWKPGDLPAEAMPGLAPEEPPSPGAERQPGGSWMEGDPMYENYQWVAMLQPTELADGEFYDRDPAELPTPAGTTIARVYAAARYGRETWWLSFRPRRAATAHGARAVLCSTVATAIGSSSLSAIRGRLAKRAARGLPTPPRSWWRSTCRLASASAWITWTVPRRARPSPRGSSVSTSR